jgi:hypothetical protein
MNSYGSVLIGCWIFWLMDFLSLLEESSSSLLGIILIDVSASEFELVTGS